MDELLRLSGARRRVAEVDAWFRAGGDPLRKTVQDWFARMRACGPDVRVLLHDGCPVACVGDVPFAYVNAFRAHASVGFFQGAALADPAGLLEGTGKRMRHVKLQFGKAVNAETLQRLITQAYDDTRRRLATADGAPAPPRLLAGGNPQIAKGDGEAPVRAYIAAMPGWKREVGRRLDALITRTAPGVRQAVRWNSPFYGLTEDGWSISFHCFARYVKVAFFAGASLRPTPPVGSKHKDVRYLHIEEDGGFDEAQFVAWVKQARRLPGMKM